MSNIFKQYREAYDAMESDPAVQRARKAIAEYQKSLQTLEAPYRERMAVAEAYLIQAGLAARKTITLFGVIAEFFKGRTTHSWKSIAQALNPPKALVDKFTNPPKPKVTVRIVSPETDTSRSLSLNAK